MTMQAGHGGWGGDKDSGTERITSARPGGVSGERLGRQLVASKGMWFRSFISPTPITLLLDQVFAG